MKPKVIWKAGDGETRLVVLAESEQNAGKKYDVVVGEQLGENALEEPTWFPVDDGLECMLAQFAIDFSNSQKDEPTIRLPIVTGHGGYGALVKEERKLFRAIETYCVSFQNGDPDVYEHSKQLLEEAREWWAKVVLPEIEKQKKGG